MFAFNDFGIFTYLGPRPFNESGLQHAIEFAWKLLIKFVLYCFVPQFPALSSSVLKHVAIVLTTYFCA